MEIKIGPIATALVTFGLGKVPPKRTADCFAKVPYYHRCATFDDLFPRQQPKADPCKITVVCLDGEAAFSEIAGMILGVPAQTVEEKFAVLFRESGFTTLLTQMEKIVHPVVADDDRTNFSFVINKDGGISPVAIFQGSGNRALHARPHEFSKPHQWKKGTRFLLRNLHLEDLALRD